MEITVSAISSGIACVKHTLPLVYSDITASAINLGDTNIYEETYLPCHQSGSLALQATSLHDNEPEYLLSLKWFSHNGIEKPVKSIELTI